VVPTWYSEMNVVAQKRQMDSIEKIIIEFAVLFSPVA
jgi:hypothetical protein